MRDNRVVPYSSIRGIYDFLRTFGDSDLETKIAKRLVCKGLDFRKTLRTSIEHIERYDNVKESFHPTRDGFGGRSLDSQKFSDWIVAAFANQVSFNDVSNGIRSINYVDFEVAPLRTTGSFWDDGGKARDSGAGGIDLLLALENDNGRIYPCIGEVKAETDKGCVYGLIQALAYAIELYPLVQQTRLSRHYPESFPGLGSHSAQGIDIAVILEAADGAGNRYAGLQDAQDLARSLTKEPSRIVGTIIRGVHFLAAKRFDNNVCVIETIKSIT